jgi:hypothetical protein
MLPLVAQRLADNVAALCDSVADVLPRCWHTLRELHRNARHKLARVPHVAAAAREEEARCKTLPVVISARYRPRDGRLARARQPTQPEDAPLVLAIRPAVYLVEEGDARVGQAGRLVLLRERVEGRIFGARETIEGVVGSCLRGLLSAPLLLDGLTALGPSRNVPVLTWTEPWMLLAWTLE